MMPKLVEISAFSNALRSVIYPFVSILSLLVLWHASVVQFEISPFVLPRPGAVLESLASGLTSGILMPHIFATLKAAIIGLFIGCTFGIGGGIVLAESTTISRFLYPIAIAAQSMPLVALAPLIVAYFGAGIESKIFLVAALCFFPTLVATITGMATVSEDIMDLYRVYSAGNLHILVNAKLPSAAHHIFGGLEIAVVLSVIGCVVGEFIGSRQGLGFLIRAKAGDLDVTTMFAAIIILAVIGSTFGLIVRQLYKRIVFW